MGLRFVSLSPPPQDGAEPHLWALQGEASQEIRWPREGVAASWRGSQGREDGRRNRKGPRRRALRCLFKLGEEAQVRGVRKRGWGVWATGRPRSRLLRPLWVCTPSPSHSPSLVPASPSCPPRNSLAQRGYRRFPGGAGTRGGGAEGRPGLWRAWSLRRGPRGRGGGG